MGIRVSIAISIRIAIITIVMRSISLSLRLSISRPLAKTLGRPGLEGGASGVESNTGVGTIGIGVSIAISIRIAIVAIQSGGISLRLSISRPLGPAPEAGGGCPGGRNSRPVGVGVVDGRVSRVVGTIEVARVSLSIRGSMAPGQQDTEHLNRK
jgi:hypothetical protein